MIHFDRLMTNQTHKTQEENMKAIKTWADNLIDDLQLLVSQIDDIQKKIESEGK